MIPINSTSTARNTEAVDDVLLRQARSVRKRYGLPQSTVDDLKQAGWVIYLASGGDFVATYWEMRHMGMKERNGYRSARTAAAARQRYLTGIDLTQFASGERLEDRTLARHALGRIVDLCAARHRSYTKTLKTFVTVCKYDRALGNRRSRLRTLLRKAGYMTKVASIAFAIAFTLIAIAGRAEAQLLIDFGATASGNQFGTAWSTVIKDKYTDYRNHGPGGTTIVNKDNLAYNYQGVRGTARQFSAGDKIVVTWYNNSSNSHAFTPYVSFNDSDRIRSGTNGTWHLMSSVNIAPRTTATTEYVFTAATAGTYALVNTNVNYKNHQILVADKIDLVTAAAPPPPPEPEPAPPPPPAPTCPCYDLAIIEWQWSQGDGGAADGFIVQAGTSPGNYQYTATLAPAARAVAVKDFLPAPGSYFFRVSAFNEAGSAPSAEIGGTVN